MGLTMQEKKALTREISKRYQKAEKKEKTDILDELVKTTGYNRREIREIYSSCFSKLGKNYNRPYVRGNNQAKSISP